MKILGKLLIILVVFLAGLMLGMTFGKSPAIAPTIKTEISDQLEVSLIIDYGNGKVSNYDNIEIQSGETAFELLKAVTEKEGVGLGCRDYGAGMGVLVESINNVKVDYLKGLYWHFWVNDKYAEIGASNYILHGGDKVEWKYLDDKFK